MKNDKKNETIVKSVKENIIEYCNRSLALESERENNILRNCNTLITCNSILLVPFITVFFELYNRLTSIRTLVVIFGMILMGVLLFSILFSIASKFISKSSYIRSGKDLMELFNKNDDSFLDQSITDLDSVLKRKVKNNNKRKNLLFISIIIHCSFYLLLFVFGMVIMIVM